MVIPCLDCFDNKDSDKGEPKASDKPGHLYRGFLLYIVSAFNWIIYYELVLLCLSVWQQEVLFVWVNIGEEATEVWSSTNHDTF